MGDIINIECASWYCRNDGLVEILSRNAKKIILNQTYSDIWIRIEYGISKDNLYEHTKNILSKERLDNILNELTKKRLINISTDTEKFDLLFK